MDVEKTKNITEYSIKNVLKCRLEAGITCNFKKLRDLQIALMIVTYVRQ